MNSLLKTCAMAGGRWLGSGRAVLAGIGAVAMLAAPGWGQSSVSAHYANGQVWVVWSVPAGLAGVLAWLWAWIRAWQHGPVASRVGFLFRALDEPGLAVRFQRFSVMVRIAMIVVLVLASIALTATIGWQRLLN